MRSASLAVVAFSDIAVEGLKSVCSESRFRIEHQYSSVEDFCDSVFGSQCPPDGLIVDTTNHLPLSGSDLAKIRCCSDGLKIVLMTDNSRLPGITAIAQDADGVIVSSVARDVLLKTLEFIFLGQAVYPAGLFQNGNDLHRETVVPLRENTRMRDVATKAADALRKLSERELQVVQLLCDGSPNKIIARKLGITESTVKVHVKAILRKAHARNRTEAALLLGDSIGGQCGPRLRAAGR